METLYCRTRPSESNQSLPTGRKLGWPGLSILFGTFEHQILRHTLTTPQFEQIEVPGATKAWIYQGNSFDAFTDNSSYDSAYLGPFNGHVNGALIMKERKAWVRYPPSLASIIDIELGLGIIGSLAKIWDFSSAFQRIRKLCYKAYPISLQRTYQP